MNSKAAASASVAISMLNAGRTDLAEKLISGVLTGDPNNADAHRVLGICLRQRHRLKEALAEADESVRLAPNSALCHLDRGRTLHSLKRLAAAEDELREALRLRPQALVFASLAGVLIDRGDLSAAEKAAREGLALDPQDSDCQWKLAYVLLYQHRIAEAHQVLRDALAGRPERSGLHNDLGIALLHRGAYAAAGVEFKEALRLNPQSKASKRNLELVEAQHRTTRKPGPYAMRIAFAWPRYRLRARLAVIVPLAVLGYFCPVAWGAAAMPITREAMARLRSVPIPLALRSRLYVAIFVGLVVLGSGVGAARTIQAAVPSQEPMTTQPAPTFDFPLPSNIWIFLPPSPQVPPDETDTSSLQAGFVLLQMLTGIVACFAVQPFVVTTGRAKAVAGFVAGLAAGFAVLGAVFGSPQNPMVLLAAFCGVAACAWRGPALVLDAEADEWQPTKPSREREG